MKLRPLHDRVIVKRLEEERVSAGGIVIPDSAAEKPSRGKVIAVGAGKVLDDGKVRPLDVKAGDTILFGKWSGTEVKVDGEELLVMREEDIQAVFKDCGHVAARYRFADRAHDSQAAGGRPGAAETGLAAAARQADAIRPATDGFSPSLSR